MKNIIVSLFIVIVSSCKAQTPVLPAYENGVREVNGAYYKDIDNFHDQFVGTWKVDDGVTYLKVTFKKKPMFSRTFANGSYYVDFLIGEYEYKLNGVPVVNTLNNLNVNHTKIFNYNLYSTQRLKNYSIPPCADCGPNKRLVMRFQELPTRSMDWAAHADFIMRIITENGVQKLKVQFIMTDPAGNIPDGLSDEYQGFSLPFGEYFLIKQP